MTCLHFRFLLNRARLHHREVTAVCGSKLGCSSQSRLARKKWSLDEVHTDFEGTCRVFLFCFLALQTKIETWSMWEFWTWLCLEPEKFPPIELLSVKMIMCQLCCECWFSILKWFPSYKTFLFCFSMTVCSISFFVQNWNVRRRGLLNVTWKTGR